MSRMSRTTSSKRRTPAPNDEQLYMLEVFIDKLNFNPERADVNVQNLTIFVKFSDLPDYELSVLKNLRDDRTENRELSGNSNVFKSGKSCLFAKSPSSLIKAIRFAPLRLEVYHNGSSRQNGNRDLVGTVKVTLPACMCTYVSNVRKETDGLSTPCVAKSDFDLIDPGGQVSGTVCVVVRLSCFGSSIVKHFLLSGKTFMLEDSPIQKFLCPNLAPNEDKKDTVEPSLKRPDSPPRISMDDPGFTELTTAEKLNDPKFRELVYRTYPDEPTCCCQPTDRSTHPMECRSGCNRPCCMKLRNPELLLTHQPKPVDDSLSNTYCVNDYLTPIEDRQDCTTSRLRGGGDIEQIYLGPTGYKWPDYDTDYTWYEEKNAGVIRLEGGAETEMSTCGCSGGNVPVRMSRSKQQAVQAAFDACKPRLTSTGPKPSCACAGKDTQMWHTGVANCSKQPCVGIDCLIRAFKETQEFVDSIGKVPGLAGLGLMDPSESPYFGRDLDKDYVPEEPSPKFKKKEHSSPQPQALPQSTCAAPCNIPAIMTKDDRPPVHYTPPAPLGAVMVPPRLGIVREAIPVIPDIAPVALGKKKRDEKKSDEKDKSRDRDGDVSTLGIIDLQNGPCGEPMCKSRRKPAIEAVDGAQYDEKAAKSKTHRKMPSAKKRRGGKGGKLGKLGRSKVTVREKGGAGGDYEYGKAVRPGKKVMRYVYFVGDYYPGIKYGHRDCIDIRMRVPANMGWLWNTLSTPGNLKPRIGWRPGAIGRALYAMLQEAKEESYTPEDSMSAITTRSADRGRNDRGRGGKAGGDRGRGATGRGRPGVERARGAAGRGGKLAAPDRSRGRSATSARQRSPRRPGGRPNTSMKGAQSALEDEEAGKDPPTLHIHRKDGTYYVTMYPIRQEPPDEAHVSEPMKPLQFKIVKNKDEASVASSSTASDMEIEFSPPAAVTRARKKPDVIHVETQVRQQEILDEIKAESAKRKEKRSRREKKAKPEPEKKEPAKGKGKA